MIEAITNLTEILIDFALGVIGAYYSWLLNRFPELGKILPPFLF